MRRCRYLSLYDPGIRCLIKTHEQCSPCAEGWGPQVPRRPDQDRGDLIVARPIAFEVEVDDLLALGGIDLVDSVEDLECRLG